MILFIDTEWADVLASDLVSLALVSDCGRYEFYAERDPLPTKPTTFVRSVVYPLLERGPRALDDDQFTSSLHVFFNQVLEVAWHGKVLVAYDHEKDMALLECALDGFESPNRSPRPPFNRLYLELLGIEFGKAVENRFASEPSLRARRHHAFTDAWVNRDAYIALRDREAWAISEFDHLRQADPLLIALSVEVLGDEVRAARWWIKKSGALGQAPCEAYSQGRRSDIMRELYAIRFSIPQ